MSVGDDMARIAEQEATLVFPRFDPQVAFDIGLALKALAEERKTALAIDIRLWDRQLFFYSMAGTTADNVEWMRRKSNCVKRFGRPSYFFTLKLADKGGAFSFDSGVDQAEIAAHGGAFPIRLVHGVIIGSITVSGAPGRDDHGFVVTAIARHLGLDATPLMLAPQ
jgi:uncharacterized protein (UPF0303 family)